MKKIISTLCTAVLAVGITACSDTADNGKISVYTSFYAMYDFAREIGGDCINVYNVCPTGTEPHDFEPTAADMAKITEGDVFIYNGLGMESWTDSVTEALSGSDVVVVNTSDNVEGIDNTQQHNVHHHADAHIWLDPVNAYAQMEAIAQGLIEADPENKDYYTERLNNCKAKTDKLLSDYQTAGLERSEIITSHEAYGSLCSAFGLTQIAINGTDNTHDPTPAHLAEITDYIKNNNIKYLFSEPLGTSSVVESIAADTGCEILVLDPFEGSTEDKDYFTVMYNNLDALKEALNGGQDGSN